MTATFSLRSRALSRLGAVSLLAAGAAIVWFTALGPAWTKLGEPYRRVEQLSQLIGPYGAAAAALPDVERELVALRALAPSTRGLIQADNAALAAAQVQSDVRAMVDRAGGRIHSTQSIAPDWDGKYQRIVLRYELSVPMDRLSDMLQLIESHVPFYFIDQVLMQAPDGGGLGGSVDEEVVLQIRWTIYAYRWAEDTWTQLSH